MSKEIDINDQFLAEKEAIRYVEETGQGDKFSFATGFNHAMKLVKESDIIDHVSDERELLIAYELQEHETMEHIDLRRKWAEKQVDKFLSNL